MRDRTAVRVMQWALVLTTLFAAKTFAQDLPPPATPPVVPAVPTAPATPETVPTAPTKGAARRGDAPASGTASGTASTERRLLPADSTTSQTIELPGRTLKFKATAGSIPLLADDGRVSAEMAYIAYQLEGATAATRPVAFIFNGGPGSASAWTHIVGFGPWRLPVDGRALSPSAAPMLVPNAETWLDFADLVFVDPVGTGFSQMSRSAADAGGGSSNPASAHRGGATPRTYYSVDGDASSVAEMIAKWLRKHDRLVSPKLLVGESYGGIRGPKVVARLQTEYGVGINALVLISPLMDYGQFRGPRHRLPMFMQSLPSIAAAAREAKGQIFTSREEMVEVEAYARGEYLTDLMRGPRDSAALDRIVKRVAALSGLPEAVVRTYGGKLDEFIYIREANRATQRQASGYDASITGDDPEPNAYYPRWDDPFSTALAAPVTSAMLGLYAKLGWTPDLTYHMVSSEAFRAWQWGNSTNGVESITQLEAALALDPNMRLLVTHGATDLRTPYFASVLLLEQLPGYADRPAGRVKLRLFPGGHMHYSRDGSRKALHDEVQGLTDAVIAAFK